MSYDFALETRLLAEAPQLHTIFSSNVMCCQNILVRYKSLFSSYTDHTSLHSMEVIAFCNELVGPALDRLNPDEIFVLLMAAYLHDSGMGISEKDYRDFSAQLPGFSDYRAAHPEETDEELIRRFHHEFSGRFIEKYQALFDFPSERHLWATVQVSRGHRRTDLFDEDEYPAELRLENGNVLHLPYLAALLRLTDELDIAEDRNIQFMYNPSSFTTPQGILEYRKHLAIRQVECLPDRLRITADLSDAALRPAQLQDLTKLRETLNECVRVIAERTPFELAQKRLELIDLHTEKAVPLP